MGQSKDEKHRQLAKQIAAKVDEPQRVLLRQWIEQLLELRASDLTALEKSKMAIALTANSQFFTAAAKLIADSAAPTELRELTGKLTAISSSRLRIATKIAQATAVVAKDLKSAAWDNRGLKARLALSGAIGGAIIFGGQGAGIAALGTAIGVPLWVVFGAGAAFVGVLYEEIAGKSPKTTYRVIDAERERRE